MGVTYSPSTVASGYNSNDTMNTNWTAAQTAFQDCLSRSGATAGGTNAMAANLDMGGYDIINYGTTITTEEQNLKDSIYQDGDLSITMSDANLTLTEEQQRQRLLFLGGSLTADRDIIYNVNYDTPMYQAVANLTSYNLNCKVSGGTSVTIPPGEVGIVTVLGITGQTYEALSSVFYKPIRGTHTENFASDANTTLTTAECLNKYLIITDTGGNLTQQRSVLLQDGHAYQDIVATNNTNYPIHVKYQSTNGVVIPAGGVAALYSNGGTLYEVPSVSSGKRGINAESGTTYSFVTGDEVQDVVITNAGAITATIEPDSTTEFPVGTELEVTQGGAGAITVAAGGGVTLNGTGLSTTAQHKSIKVRKVADDTWRKVSYD